MSSASSLPAQPNILLLFDDQHRFDWLGCVGADWLRTPHLDRLAARGMLLSHCCTNSPLCVPARISLATGLLPRRTGMLDNSGFLHRGLPTYYQRLRAEGYRVGCVGKLHMAKPGSPPAPAGDRPCLYQWGFTHPEEHDTKLEAGLQLGGGFYAELLRREGWLEKYTADYRRRKKSGWHRACEDSILPKELSADVVTGERAVRWLDGHAAGGPWHLYVSFDGPHDPFDPPAPSGEAWRQARMPEPRSGNREAKPRAMQEIVDYYDEPLEHILRARRQYAALIEIIDEQVGRILAKLEELGQIENTYVFFSSDHGEMLGDHRLFRKRCFYEAALRVPLLAAGPGIAPGRRSEALIELMDVGATICDLAGLSPAENVDALSFAPLLRGETGTHRANILSQIDTRYCVRTERYKYIQTPNDRAELYDLQEDPGETANLIDDRSDLAGQLQDMSRQRLLSGLN